jgi:hypothetical protein
MADSKITALTALTAADPANDMIPIVDVSDTPPASGNTKRISINNLLACSPSATLASATISGDLTVNTNVLKVDSTNDRVGIVQATPLYPLHLVGEFGLQEETPAGSGTKLRFIGDATKYNFRLGKQLTATNTFEITPSTAVGGTTFSNPVYTVTYDGIHTFLDGAGGTRMTLNSTGLGVGGSPSARIHAIDSGGVCALFTRAVAPAAALSAVYIQAPVSSGFSSTPVLNFWYQNTGISNPASETMSIRTNNAERIRYGSDGNAYHSLQGTVPTIPNNGEMVFNFTSNTNLRISARGSDGITRVANITLA